MPAVRSSMEGMRPAGCAAAPAAWSPCWACRDASRQSAAKTVEVRNIGEKPQETIVYGAAAVARGKGVPSSSPKDSGNRKAQRKDAQYILTRTWKSKPWTFRKLDFRGEDLRMANPVLGAFNQGLAPTIACFNKATTPRGFKRRELRAARLIHIDDHVAP